MKRPKTTKASSAEHADVQGGIALIVGLGNPGDKYDQTRHNAGFWFVDELARQAGVAFQADKKLSSHICRLNERGSDVWLQKPQTFMNLSGRAVQQICTFYKIPMEQILVVHDEIDLPPGTVKLKRGGGHGGHNGLRDIISHSGKDFWRLRLGVGHPGHRDEVIDYVLKRPGRTDEALIRENIDAAVSLVPDIIEGKLEHAMHVLHSAR